MNRYGQRFNFGGEVLDNYNGRREKREKDLKNQRGIDKYRRE